MSTKNEDRYAILYEYPTVMISGLYGHKEAKSYRADLSVIDRYNQSLVAVVEVGQLSNDSKLEEWEAQLPGVRIIHIRKADVESSRFILTTMDQH